ncbi:hypothetical protein [Caulobacter sp. B11]|uniref:hypothetical protein n=1 Tax=Caulobacter sp. B11 TaxID=2048899 RepID=UPI00117C0A55|nr:hypothetical protein [Caulobacter sp. B11]
MDALFYPTLSLPGSAWTNPNLLFFDEIGVIAPDADPRELFDGPTRMLIDFGLVRPVEPRRFGLDDEADGHVLSHLLGMAQGPQKRNEVARIHLGKLAYGRLSSELCDLKLLWPSYRSDWLEGPAWVVEYVMSVFATRMALHPQLNASLLTNQRAAERLVAGVAMGEQTRWSRRMRAVMRLLPIGPGAEIAEIVRFKETHARELRSFRSLIESLIRRSPDGEAGEFDFAARLRQAEMLRDHLVGEVSAIRTTAPPLPIALSIAGMVAPLVEASYASAGAALAGIGYLLHTRGSARTRERTAYDDKLVYAALAANSFAPRRSDDILA